MQTSTQTQDWPLLRQYVEQNSQAAFALLVKRHLNLVYATCRREVGDDTLAEDVTQAVFLLLARKAPSLRAGTHLSGWLFQTARFAARNAQTRELRRLQYEQKAGRMMAAGQIAQNEALWGSIEPFLNDALARLPPGDREAILLRFWDDQSLAETGAALGISEDAARKRVARAVERLRRLLGKQGVLVPGATLAVLLPAHAAVAAPATLAPAIAQITAGITAGHVLNASLAGSHAYQLSEGVLRAMKIAQMKVIAGVVAMALVGSATYAVVHAAGEKPPSAAAVPPGTPYAGSLTSGEVIQRCQTAYNALESYSGTTTVHNQAALPGQSAQTATIQFLRPGKIRVTGLDTNRNVYTIVSDGVTSFLQANGSWQKMTSTEYAIGGATGISGMAATTIPALLLHTGWGYPFSPGSSLGALTLANQDGHPCYQVTQTGPPGFINTFWVDRKTFLLRRLVQNDSGTAMGRSFQVRDDMHFTIAAINQPMPASTFTLPPNQ